MVILGSTGSIGRQAVDVVEGLRDRLSVTGLVAGGNAELLASQARRLKPRFVALATEDPRRFAVLESLLAGTGVQCMRGGGAVEEAAGSSDADLVLNAVVGARGLRPTVCAIRAGKAVALANKEPLVTCGRAVMTEAARFGSKVIPVDSEPSAIFQCLEGEDRRAVARLIVTSSGGALRDWPLERLAGAGLEDALRHPTWSMGVKVTVDSATLMNKALEVIEARWLFGVSEQRIKVVIHPESIVHSMVEFVDGSVKAQLARPDMRLPIQYALTYPDRLPRPRGEGLPTGGCLRFLEPDPLRYPALSLGYSALAAGGMMACVMNAANEAAVELFARGELEFTGIASLVETVMESFSSARELHVETEARAERLDLDAVEAIDRWAREEALRAAALRRCSSCC